MHTHDINYTIYADITPGGQCTKRSIKSTTTIKMKNRNVDLYLVFDIILMLQNCIPIGFRTNTILHQTYH